MLWHGGIVYYEEEYPKLLFARDGEVFLPGIDQSRVDKSTEKWLDRIEDRLEYRKWYCGHYHTEKKIDRMEIMFENVDVFLDE